MYLKWTSKCYKCECPLEPKIVTRGIVNKLFVREYQRIRPLFLKNNRKFYSFVGLTVKKVCYACYVNKVKIQPKLLMNREIGNIKHIIPRSKSKTESEIVNWYDGLIRRAYLNNINVNTT